MNSPTNTRANEGPGVLSKIGLVSGLFAMILLGGVVKNVSGTFRAPDGSFPADFPALALFTLSTSWVWYLLAAILTLLAGVGAPKEGAKITPSGLKRTARIAITAAFLAPFLVAAGVYLPLYLAHH